MPFLRRRPTITAEQRVQLVADHVESSVGPVTGGLTEFLANGIPLSLMVVPADEGRPYVTIVSNGMSGVPMSGPRGRRHIELILRLPADWPSDETGLQSPEAFWPLQMMLQVAAFAHEYDRWVWTGHTVGQADPEPWGPDVAYTAMLLRRPEWLTPTTDRVVVDGETDVRLLSVVPLHQEELLAAHEWGAGSMIGALGAAGASDLVTPDRPSVGGNPPRRLMELAGSIESEPIWESLAQRIVADERIRLHRKTGMALLPIVGPVNAEVPDSARVHDLLRGTGLSVRPDTHTAWVTPTTHALAYSSQYWQELAARLEAVPDERAATGVLAEAADELGAGAFPC